MHALLGRPGLAWLWDHAVQGRAILPGAAMLEMATAAGKARCMLWIQLAKRQKDDPQATVMRSETTERLPQVLFSTETLENEVALCSAAIPAPLVLNSAGLAVATARIDLRSGTAEVGMLRLVSDLHV